MFITGMGEHKELALHHPDVGLRYQIIVFLHIEIMFLVIYRFNQSEIR